MNRDETLRLIFEVVSSSQAPSEIVCGRVIKSDAKRKLVWLEELGDQPIPLVGFRGYLRYLEKDANGAAQSKRIEIDYDVPSVGDTVAVLKQSGENRLSKCVGVILSTGYVGE
jgi:hypothetical protein